MSYPSLRDSATALATQLEQQQQGGPRNDAFFSYEFLQEEQIRGMASYRVAVNA